MDTKPQSIDAYLDKLSAKQRAALELLRQTIRAAAPKAEECISYQIPAFRQTKMLVGFGATVKHCAFYLMSGNLVEKFQKELKGYDTSKGTIRFLPENPLPASLIRKLVKARLLENKELHKSGSAKEAVATPTKAITPTNLKQQVNDVLTWLKQNSTEHDLSNMPRFGITAQKAFGVSMANMRKLAKKLGMSHSLASALWKTGWYEARMMAILIDDPALVTSKQMDQWSRDFDSWAICDTACFHLFDRVPQAWKKIPVWAKKKEEFEKRTAFALLASLALHDKQSEDDRFAESLILIEEAATDDRNFVKKGVNWSLRAIGGRSSALQAAAIALANRLAASKDSTSRWIGKDAIRKLAKREKLQKPAGKRKNKA